MPTSKLVSAQISICILLCLSIIAFGQHDTTSDDQYLSARINTHLDSMSTQEKINQLVLIRAHSGYADSTYSLEDFGAILTTFQGPSAHLNFVSDIGDSDPISPLVFAEMREDVYGIDMDSIALFGSELTISAITEPHLMYGTGKALAEQCNMLGIDGLLSQIDELETKRINSSDWRLSEINQGLTDHGSLPIDRLEVRNFKFTNLLQFINEDSTSVIMVDEEDIGDYFMSVQNLIESDTIDSVKLDNKVQQLLTMKLSKRADTTLIPQNQSLHAGLNTAAYKLLREELLASSITLLKNDKELLPITTLEKLRIASVTLGKKDNELFNDILDNYLPVDHYSANYNDSSRVFAELWATLSSYDLIICNLHESDFLSTRLIEAQAYMLFQGILNQSEKAIIAYFGDPALLGYNNQILNNSTMILSYEENSLIDALMAQLIFGAVDIAGVLPVTVGDHSAGTGERIEKLGRFTYSSPESVGLDSRKLTEIDSLVVDAIRAKAIPGCQVLVARNNSVVYKKSFGYHTYDSLRKVSNDDLYDLASITKVSGALPGLMKLYEEQKFNLDTTMGTYVRYFKKGKMKKLTFREILAHQAGLKPWIPYWESTIKKNGKYKGKTLSTTPDDDFPYQVADNLYVHKDFKKKIYKQIRKSKVGEKKYLYSGLTFYIYPDIIEEITGQDFQEYIRSNFYDPLGANTLTFNPLNSFQLDQIVPTEYDSLFRKSQIHGRVHDEGAAMMHGVSSNAGLFANANDLAKLFQMYCNYGTYGGREYLKSQTVLEFAKWQYPDNDNRRGLGFDRPLLQPHENGNTAKSVSQLSFGHTGFTGTFAWADPYYNIVYIFLSNRVYQTRNNTKLYKMNVRTNVQEAIYQAIND